MKKFFLILAMAASAMSMSAQEGYYGNKFWDNWYLGLEAGVSSKTTHQAVLKHLNPEFGFMFITHVEIQEREYSLEIQKK